MLKMRKLILLQIFLSFLALSFLYAKTSIDPDEGTGEWKAGVASIVITPEQPMWLAGYAARNHPSEGTMHDLWAKALVLEDLNEERAVLITSDLLEFPKNLSDHIRDRLEDQFSLSRSQIILSSSHTHSGPVLSGALYDIYPLDSDQLEKIDQYSGKLADQIVKLVGPDVLPDQQRLVLFVAELIKNGFLQQSAFDENDMYCVPERQVGILRVLMLLYRRGSELVGRGAPLARLRELPSIQAVVRARLEVPDDAPEKLAEIQDRLTAELDELERSYT